MSGSISFNEIPGATLKLPGFYAEISNERAIGGLVARPSRVLAIGQKLAAGTAAAGVPIRVSRASEAVGAFGRGSMLAAMALVFLSGHEFGELWALPLADNGAGVAATKTVTFSNAAANPGTLHLYVAGTRVSVAVAPADTPAQIATRVAAAITDLPDLPVTAAAAAAIVTLTARHKGESGQAIDVRAGFYADETPPAGLGIAIANGVAGSGNPDIAAALAALGDAQYHHVIMPYTDTANLAALEADLASRWGGTRMIEGQAWTAFKGNYAATDAFGDSRNSQFVVCIGTGPSPMPPWLWAASLAAQAARALDDDPARPLQTLVLKGVLPPAEIERFIRTERNLLLGSGIATYTVDFDGTVRIERAVTMYKTNALGLPDPSYLDAETIATLGYLRFSMRAWLAQKYPRYKLADDGTNFAPGQAIVTPSIIRAELIAWFRACEELGLVENGERFKQGLRVMRNAVDRNRVDALIPPDVVNQLRIFAGKIEFVL